MHQCSGDERQRGVEITADGKGKHSTDAVDHSAREWIYLQENPTKLR